MLPTGIATIILATSAVVMMSLAVLVFRIDKKSPANLFFSLWMLALSAWALTLTAFFASDNDAMALLWMRAAYATAIIGIVAFFYFATQFPRPTALHPAVHVANLLTLVLFDGAIMLTPLLVQGVGGQPRSEHVAISTVGWSLYAVYLLFHFLAAHVLLFAKYRRSSGVERVQLKYVVWSVFVGGEVFGVLFNLILPSPIFRRWDLIWLGPAATAGVIVPFVAYAVTKHSLFNFRGIVTEILVFYMMVFVLIDALLSESVWGFAFRGSVALGMAFFGVVLILRINADERRRRELQRLTLQLREANVHLKEMDQLKSEFISIASHQLRTPISVIKGYLSLMLEGAYGKVDGPLKEKITTMSLMNERLVQMINNMLNVSRIEKNKIDYVCETVDLSPLMERAVMEMSFKAAQKGLALTFDREGAEGLKAYVDPEKLLEVLTNLIDNAIKYSHEGTITLAGEKVAKGAMLTVTDQGIGMNAQTAARVFQKFFRAKDAAVTREAGTGLGLYIVGIFVRSMGGDVWIARSVPGKGTTIALTVPGRAKGKCLRP